MKKGIIALGISLISVFSYAQTTNKHGENILPSQGDFGVSANLTPLIRPLFVLNQNQSNHSQGLFDNGKTLALKYMLKDDFALRSKFRFGYTSSTFKSSIQDDLEAGQNINSINLEENVVIKDFNYTILVGVEKRRGSGRLQGVFGGETGVLFGNGLNATYNYANEVSEDNANPSTSDFSSRTGFENITNNGRIVSQDFGYQFSYILRGFVGMEYYFLPKLSLGLEFYWGMDLSSTKDGVYKEEFWDSANSTVNSVDVITRGATSFGIDNYEAIVNFNFYF